MIEEKIKNLSQCSSGLRFSIKDVYVRSNKHFNPVIEIIIDESLNNLSIQKNDAEDIRHELLPESNDRVQRN